MHSLHKFKIMQSQSSYWLLSAWREMLCLKGLIIELSYFSLRAVQGIPLEKIRSAVLPFLKWIMKESVTGGFLTCGFQWSLDGSAGENSTSVRKTVTQENSLSETICHLLSQDWERDLGKPFCSFPSSREDQLHYITLDKISDLSSKTFNGRDMLAPKQFFFW